MKIIFFFTVLQNIIFSAWSQSIDPLKLTWADYGNNVDLNEHMTAFTCGNIVYHYKVNPDRTKLINVAVVFDPNKSWLDWTICKDSSKKFMDYLLNHERLHLYITILYAKKLKIYYKTHQPLTGKEATDIANYYSLQAKKENNNYDTDTDHSKIHSKQLAWETNIANQLEIVKNTKLDTP
jgi:hypothetical protein